MDGADLPGADAAESADDAAPDAPPAPSVGGQVVDRFLRPLPGVKVALVGEGVTLTDVDGRYSFAGVTPPYDLVIIDESSSATNPSLLVLDDLTVVDARVQIGPRSGFDDPSAAFNHEATLDMFIVAGTITIAVASMPNSSAQGYLLTADTLRFDRLKWFGGVDQPVALHALHWDENPVTELPTDFIEAGELTATVHDGTPLTVGPMTMTPITDGTIDYTIDFVGPPGLALHADAEWTYDDGSYIYMGTQFSMTGSFVVPDVTGGSVTLRGASGTEADGSVSYRVSGHHVGDTVTIAMPSVPLPAVPGPGANVGPGQVFTWQSGGGALGVYSIFMEPIDTAGPRIVLITASTNVTVPDLAAIGLTWPAGKKYAWFIETDAALPTVDSLVDPALQVAEGQPPREVRRAQAHYREMQLVP